LRSGEPGRGAAWAAAFGFQGRRSGADQAGPAGGVAGLVGLEGLAQDLGRDGGLADVDGLGGGEQGQRAGRGPGPELAERGPLRAAGKFVQVAAAELVEPGRVVAAGTAPA
jgi:hypothetical protein